MIAKGSLHIVATPIGNLGDITYRAVEILSRVPFILAEDTRYTLKLLNRYKIKSKLVSYRDQNHEKMIDKVMEKLDAGLDLALVSDCGTPLISDPGYKLVADLRERGYAVLTVPGPSALVAAMSISGLPTDKFVFLGFLPKSDGKRAEWLKKYGNIDCTIVIYESPKRLLDLLKMAAELYGSDRKVAVMGELTKIHESVKFGKLGEVVESYADKSILGEYVVCIGKEGV